MYIFVFGRKKGEHDTLRFVARCYVGITGKDGKKHFLTIDATSAFDAVEQAIMAWGRLWWWSSEAIAAVRRGEQSWQISVSNVIARRRKPSHS